MKNQIEKHQKTGEEVLLAFLKPIEKREKYISPVTFIKENEKTGAIEDIVLGIGCHPSCYADRTISQCGTIMNEGNTLAEINGDDLIACSYAIEHTFKSRATIELFNTAIYVYGDICAMYGVPLGYHIPACDALVLDKKVPDKSLLPDEISAFNEIYDPAREHCFLDLTAIGSYCSTITNYTIPYIANALLANIMRDITFDDKIMVKNSPEMMDRVCEMMPHYHAVFMSTLINLMNLANFYRDNNPTYLKLEAGHEVSW